MSTKNSLKEELNEAYILQKYGNKTSVLVFIKNQQLSQVRKRTYLTVICLSRYNNLLYAYDM